MITAQLVLLNYRMAFKVGPQPDAYEMKVDQFTICSSSVVSPFHVVSADPVKYPHDILFPNEELERSRLSPATIRVPARQPIFRLLWRAYDRKASKHPVETARK